MSPKGRKAVFKKEGKKMSDNKTIVVIDARSRALAVHTASATALEDGGIVLRRAADLGWLRDLDIDRLSHQIMVVGSYEARQSAGFTEVKGAAGKRVAWVGGAGYGGNYRDEGSRSYRRSGYALRPFGAPVEGRLLPIGVEVARVGHKNSNSATRQALLNGLAILASSAGVLTLAEGQSDYAEGWVFKVSKDAEYPDLPPEHREEDIFNPVSRASASLRRNARQGVYEGTGDTFDGVMAARIAAMTLAAEGGEAPESWPNLPPTVSLDELLAANSHWLEDWLEAGGTFVASLNGDWLEALADGRRRGTANLPSARQLMAGVESGLVSWRADLDPKQQAIRWVLSPTSIHYGETWQDAYRRIKGEDPDPAVESFIEALSAD